MGALHVDSEAPKGLRQRLASGGAWALIGKGGTLGLNFLALALVARFLPPTEAGAYFLAQSVVMAVAILTVHWSQGFKMGEGGKGFEWQTALFCMALCLFLRMAVMLDLRIKVVALVLGALWSGVGVGARWIGFS